VGDVLGPGHLSFFVHEIVERLDLRAIEDSYSEEGQPGYHPRLLLKLWLYACSLGITSSRRLEQRTREDLGFRFLAGGSTPDYLRTRSGFELGYTADIAVSEDHLIVGQRITRNPTDTRSLDEMVEQVEQRCGETPGQVSADSGFYRNEEVQAVTARGADVYVPDSNMAQELNGGRSADETAGCIAHYGPAVSQMRAKITVG